MADGLHHPGSSILTLKVRRAQVRFFFAFFALAELLGASSSSEGFLRSVSEKIHVDGTLRDWPVCQRFRLSGPEHVLRGKALWREDAHADFFLTYDSDFLYVAGVLQTGFPLNEGDFFTIGLRAAPSESTEARFRFLWDTGKRLIIQNVDFAREVPGARGVVRELPGGWMLEASLPWEVFPEVALDHATPGALEIVLFHRDSSHMAVEASLSGFSESLWKPDLWKKIIWEGPVKIQRPLKAPEGFIFEKWWVAATSERSLGNMQTLSGRVFSGEKAVRPWVGPWPLEDRATAGEEDGSFRWRGKLLAQGDYFFVGACGFRSRLFSTPGKAESLFHLEPMPAGLWVESEEFWPTQEGPPERYFADRVLGFRLTGPNEKDPEAWREFYLKLQELFRQTHMSADGPMLWVRAMEDPENFLGFLRLAADLCDGVYWEWKEENAFENLYRIKRLVEQWAFWPLSVALRIPRTLEGVELWRLLHFAQRAGWRGVWVSADRLSEKQMTLWREAWGGEPLPSASERPDCLVGGVRLADRVMLWAFSLRSRGKVLDELSLRKTENAGLWVETGLAGVRKIRLDPGQGIWWEIPLAGGKEKQWVWEKTTIRENTPAKE